MYAEMIASARNQADLPMRLAVLPGLSFISDLGEAEQLAEPIPGRSSQWAEGLADQLGIFVVISIPEADGGERHITAIIVGPEGIVGRSRQAHRARLPNPWAMRGDDPFRTWDTPLGRLGILHGEDGLYPEAARCLAIQGADIVCAPSCLSGPEPIDLPPTNVPLAEEILAVSDRAYWHLWRIRAAENNCYTAFANRSDQGCMGWSGVFGPDLFQFPRSEVLIQDRQVECAVAVVNTKDYLAPESPNSVRFKPMIRMRMPVFYDALISPVDTGNS
jgi:predicted amidohydrolase